MNRQLVGAIFVAIAAMLYAIRHFAAMAFIANKTGDLDSQYEIALRIGGRGLLAFSIIALLIGAAYLLWGEYESHRAGR